jgi:hypothetical protein
MSRPRRGAGRQDARDGSIDLVNDDVEVHRGPVPLAIRRLGSQKGTAQKSMARPRSSTSTFTAIRTNASSYRDRRSAQTFSGCARRNELREP